MTKKILKNPFTHLLSVVRCVRCERVVGAHSLLRTRNHNRLQMLDLTSSHGRVRVGSQMLT